MKKKKILVVDNHPIILEYMTKFLSKEGHEVRTSGDGLHALDILEGYDPDIIFIDLIMPNIDGKKLCQIIRAMPEMKDKYLIILSAAAAEEQIDFKAIGANACIAKGPLDKMGQYVIAALHDAELGRTQKTQERIFGVENLYSRQITKELLSIWKHYEVVLGSLSEGILEITPGGRIVFANPTAVSLTGIPEEKLLASSVLGLFNPRERDRVREIIDRVASEASVVVAEKPVKLNDREFMVKLLPIRDEMKRTLIMVLNDVSEHRRIEAQFQLAQRMEAVGTLAGGIAHDFNNLLQAISGYTQLLLMRKDASDPDFSKLEVIQSSTLKASELTKQLLIFSRKMESKLKPLDLNHEVMQVCKLLQRTIPRMITIDLRLSDSLKVVNADSTQLEQILMNLGVNARDAMADGGTLTFQTENVYLDRGYTTSMLGATPGEYILLTVSDTGHGMDKETLQHIFEPFYTTKEAGKGTGLGLAIVQDVLEAYGWVLRLDSSPALGGLRATIAMDAPTGDQPNFS